MSAFWLFMALWILNYSIDIPDPQSDAVKEDLSYNDVESVVELIFEEALGWTNFIPESDEDDPEDSGGFAKKIEIAFVFRVVEPKVVESKQVVPTIEHHFDYLFNQPQNPFVLGLIKPPQT